MSGTRIPPQFEANSVRRRDRVLAGGGDGVRVDQVASTKELIETAAGEIIKEIPAFARLKLVVRVDLRSRGDEQTWRLELPGPTASKDPARSAKIEVSMTRRAFNDLAHEGGVARWRDAIERGDVRVTGQEQILRLIETVVARHLERARLKKRKV